jgi:holliday junction DNA helicase RuvA
MYEYLDGLLTSRRPTRIVLEVAGVGYDLAVPLGVDFRVAGEEVPTEEGRGKVRVWTHLVVREDSHQLFGFPTRADREVFRLLLVVRGVGPGLALAILSGLPGPDLFEAIAAGDSAALTRIKGVGKKTAQQILLDLHDRAPVGDLADDGTSDHSSGSSRALEDAVGALVSIGYSEKDARRSVKRAAEEVDPGDLELLLRTALRS